MYVCLWCGQGITVVPGGKKQVILEGKEKEKQTHNGGNRREKEKQRFFLSFFLSWLVGWLVGRHHGGLSLLFVMLLSLLLLPSSKRGDPE